MGNYRTIKVDCDFHTTVKHATESVESRKKTDPRFREEYENIKTIITA